MPNRQIITYRLNLDEVQGAGEYATKVYYGYIAGAGGAGNKADRQI